MRKLSVSRKSCNNRMPAKDPGKTILENYFTPLGTNYNLKVSKFTVCSNKKSKRIMKE